MAKSKNIFVCQECGTESSKWIGRCPACGQWNTYVEEVKITGKGSGRETISYSKSKEKPLPFNKVIAENYQRINSSFSEFDRILGGGIVPGSFILLGGEPGIGKSTLALQLTLDFKGKVLYVSGEESAGQIKMRADRIGKTNDNCLIYSETNLEDILIQFEHESPELLVIDSIQTIYSQLIESAPGSVSQVRECATRLLRVAKEKVVPVILIGHITKDGSLAGPKVLEHIVDAVIQFEGEQNLNYRIIRSLKNRFGAVPELAIFEMGQAGLKQILNPSELFLHESENLLSGVAVACTMDGIKPLLIETQALVGTAVYGTPQRSSTGFDLRRLNMLLAVLEKKGGFNVSNKDVFLNIAGGMKIQDTAADLAIVSAIVSSRIDQPLSAGTCCCAEISLTGELRPVHRIEQRILEAKKLGFKHFVLSSYQKNIDKIKGIEIKKASSINDALKNIFQKAN
ncbi:MAG: DNA repair protein RadA [Bacteroidales bacterium]|nr:DNA repair protein RadA [Bacteroidales bacterium]MBN2817649.1 DNA repair protein RadA [Bacteroidales bacterium]